MSKVFVLLIGISLLSSCIPKKEEDQTAEKIDTSELCYIQFYIVNNQAKIYIDGDLVADTGIINEGAESEEAIVLSDYLDKGKHKLKIELFNGQGLATDEFDKYWEIYYELFLRGEPIDYIHEIDEYSRGNYGLVWTHEYEIEI